MAGGLKVSARQASELASISGYVHDAWLDLPAQVEGSTYVLSGRLAANGRRARISYGDPFEIRVHGVATTDVMDEAQIGGFNVDSLVLDESGLLAIIGHQPVALRFEVPDLLVEFRSGAIS